MLYHVMNEADAEAAEASQNLLTEIAAKHQVFTVIDKEYQQALQRKIEWQAKTIHSMSWDDEYGPEDYPFEYEVTQWSLKRDIAEKELQQLINQINPKLKAA